MVDVKQSEKKIPVTILETKIADKTFQFITEIDSSVDNCILALNEFTNYAKDMNEKYKEKIEIQEEKNVHD